MLVEFQFEMSKDYWMNQLCCQVGGRYVNRDLIDSVATIYKIHKKMDIVGHKELSQGYNVL